MPDAKKVKNKYTAKAEHKIALYKNCLLRNNTLTLFYIVEKYNYGVYSEDSINAYIQRMYNVIGSLDAVIKQPIFTIYNFDDIISPTNYIESFIETIRLWNPNFTPSNDFVNNIPYLSQKYCVLAINIDSAGALDLGDMSAKEIVSQLIKQASDYLASFRQMEVDTERVDKISQDIQNMAHGVFQPMPEQILLQFILKKMFPSYQILLKDEEEDYAKEVLTYLQQEITPYFNYFVMSNSGVEYFRQQSRETYGCVLNVVELPDEIDTARFDLSEANLVVNAKILGKEEARLRLKRSRADLKFEQESAAQAGGSDSVVELEDVRENIETGLASVSVGNKLVEVDMKMLILADSLEELNERRSSLIQACRDIGIILTFSPNQATSYLNSFVWNRGTGYDFLLELKYILSFQANRGALLGDEGEKYTSPIFGTTVDNVSEIVE